MEVLAWFPAVYALIGVCFALAFVSVGVKRLDPRAVQASIGFRLCILPGAAVFWPVLLRRWMQGRQGPPTPFDAHRSACCGPSCGVVSTLSTCEAECGGEHSEACATCPVNTLAKAGTTIPGTDA